MTTRGERLFSHWFLRHQDDAGGRLFGRFTFASIYAVFLGLATLAHKALLAFIYYKVVEGYGEDPVPLVYLDGIPSLVAPAYGLVTAVALCFILCSCCGMPYKVRRLVDWCLALLLGTTAVSLVSYAAQIILYVVRIVLLYLEKKVSLVAICTCAPLGSDVTGNGIYITREPSTSSLTDASGRPSRLPSASPSDTTSSITPTGEREGSSAPSETAEFWCLCEVPFEDYPIGVSTSDPSAIDAAFLSRFISSSYEGNVTAHVVNSTHEVINNTEQDLSDETIMLAAMQGIALIIALRVPLWLVINNIWSHLDCLDYLERWHLLDNNQETGIRQPPLTTGRRLWAVIRRADAYINFSKYSSSQQQNARKRHDSDDDAGRGYEDGLLDAFNVRQEIPDPPHSARPAFALLFYCLLTLSDAFSLISELTYRPHYFKDNMTLTYLTLTAIGMAIAVTTLMNVLTAFPDSKRSLSLLLVRFLCVPLASLPLLSVRLWLAIEHGYPVRNWLHTGFLAFMISETVASVFAAVDFAMELSRIRVPDGTPSRADGLARWRSHPLGPKPHSIISSSSTPPGGHVNIGFDFGETSDAASSVSYHSSVYDSDSSPPPYQRHPAGVSVPGSGRHRAETFTDHRGMPGGFSTFDGRSNASRQREVRRGPSSIGSRQADGKIKTNGTLTSPWYKRFAVNAAPNDVASGRPEVVSSAGEEAAEEGSTPQTASDFVPRYTEEQLKRMIFYI